MKPLKPTHKPVSRLEWLRLRQSGMGSSDAAALCGLGYQSALEVFLSKVQPIEEEPEMTEAQKIGLELEKHGLPEIVLKRYVEQNPGAEVKLLPADGLFRHPHCPIMLATPDYHVAINGELGDLSLKTTGWRMAKNWVDGDIPAEAHIQSHHQMECIPELRFSLVGALIFTPQIVFRMVDRDEAIGAALRENCENFWRDHVETKRPPALSFTESPDTLLRLFPLASAGEIILPDEYGELLTEYKAAAAREKKAKAEKDEAGNALRMALGKHVIGRCYNGEVRWGNAKTSKFDAKALKEKMPQVYKEFLREGTTRRLTVKLSEAEEDGEIE